MRKSNYTKRVKYRCLSTDRSECYDIFPETISIALHSIPRITRTFAKYFLICTRLLLNSALEDMNNIFYYLI